MWQTILLTVFLLTAFFLSNALFKSVRNNFKGKYGENIVRTELLAQLPSDIYKIFNHIYVPNKKGGVTEIDHIVVSQYGIFVLETKNYSGYLYGKETDSKWTQVHGFGKYKTQIGNPVRQNKGHIAYLAKFLNVPENILYPIVCFVGSAVIKTMLPSYVMKYGWVRYIGNFKKIIISERRMQYVINKLTQLGESRSSLKREHRHYLRKRRL